MRHVEKQLRNERILLLDPLPIQGLETFLDVGNKLAYGGESPAYRKERVCDVPSDYLNDVLMYRYALSSRTR